MPKVKIKANDNLPPMPDSPEDILEGTPEREDSGQLTGSEERTEQTVTDEFAGDLYKIPFQVWHIFNPNVPDEPDPKIIKGVSGPFARVLDKYGLGKLAKDEILVGFYLTQTVYVYVQAAKRAKELEPEKAKIDEPSSVS